MRDEDLQKLLLKWEVPATPPTLDTRVYASLRGTARPRSSFWIPLAAAAAGVGVVVGLWMRRPVEIEMSSGVISTSSGVTIETDLNVTGFQPIRNAKLVAVKETE